MDIEKLYVDAAPPICHFRLMSAYAVIATAPNTNLDAVVAREFPDKQRVASNVWLVAAKDLTSREVGDKLGLTGGALGSVIVIKIDYYWGWAGKNIWEWLGVKATD